MTQFFLLNELHAHFHLLLLIFGAVECEIDSHPWLRFILNKFRDDLKLHNRIHQVTIV